MIWTNLNVRSRCGYFERLVDLRFLRNALEGMSVLEKLPSKSGGFEAVTPHLLDKQLL
jgi:hypothetical protein